MGTWGTAIFSDDTAADVRDDFKELVTEGVPAAEATRQVVARWANVVADPDEGPVFWLALAATQAKMGRLQDDVRDRAVEVIDSGADLRRWQDEAEPSDVEKRRRHLAKLREQLVGPQKPPTRVRRASTYVETTDWSPGDHWAYRLPSGRWVVLRVVALRPPATGGTGRLETTWPGTLPVVEVVDGVWDEPPPLDAARRAGARRGERAQLSRRRVRAFIVARATKRDFPADRLTFVGRAEAPFGGIAGRIRRVPWDTTELVLWKWFDRTLAEHWGLE